MLAECDGGRVVIRTGLESIDIAFVRGPEVPEDRVKDAIELHIRVPSCVPKIPRRLIGGEDSITQALSPWLIESEQVR